MMNVQPNRFALTPVPSARPCTHVISAARIALVRRASEELPA